MHFGLAMVIAIAGQVAAAEDVKRAALEKAFAETMTDCVLVGYWQMTGAEGLAGKDKMSPPRPEKYTIDGVEKVKGDTWVIRSRIQFEDVDVALPLHLDVIWAGDTPVITVDKIGIPGVGTYSARVMIYGNFYSGTWFGDGYGGVLSGQIVKRSIYEKWNPPAKTTDDDKDDE